MPCPVKHPTAAQIATELYAALQRNCAWHWLFAQSIEEVISRHLRGAGMAEAIMERKVVAAHLAKLLPSPRYKRTDIQGGEVRKLFHYFIPHPQNVVVPPRR